jgi:hypothetical protein
MRRFYQTAGEMGTGISGNPMDGKSVSVQIVARQGEFQMTRFFIQILAACLFGPLAAALARTSEAEPAPAIHVNQLGFLPRAHKTAVVPALGAMQIDARDCKVPYPSRLPARSYLDEVCSYTTSEVAINWNAPLAYVSGALQLLTR